MVVVWCILDCQRGCIILVLLSRRWIDYSVIDLFARGGFINQRHGRTGQAYSSSNGRKHIASTMESSAIPLADVLHLSGYLYFCCNECIESRRWGVLKSMIPEPFFLLLSNGREETQGRKIERWVV